MNMPDCEYDPEHDPKWLEFVEDEELSRSALQEETKAEKRAREKEWERRKRESRVSYLLTPEIKERIGRLAERHKASKSEIARLLLEVALDLVEQEKITLELEFVDEARLIVRKASKFF